MKSIKKTNTLFILKLAVFIFLTALILKACILPVVPNLAFDRKYGYELDNLNEIELKGNDLAFFGNSLVYTAYDPTLIQERLGVSAFHFNSPSQVLESSLIAAKYVLEEKPFKYVVFDVSQGSLIRPRVEKEKDWYYQSIALQETPLSYEKYKKVNAFFLKEDYFEYYINALSSTFGKTFQLNERENFGSKNINPYEYYHFRGALFSERGYFAYDFNNKAIGKEVFDSEFYKTASPQFSSEKLWNENLKEELIDFIALAENKGTEVVLINSLKLREENYNTDFIDSLKKQFSNLEFINLNSNRSKYHLTNSSFFDGSHLTYLGSHEVSNRLIDSLSKWYNIPKQDNYEFSFKSFNLKNFSYNLENWEDKFIKLEFDSIPKSLRDHQLAIYIYANDTLKLSDNSKAKKSKSDNFHVKMSGDEIISTRNSRVVIKRIQTKISTESIEKIKVFFYKQNDTIKIPEFEFYPNVEK